MPGQCMVTLVDGYPGDSGCACLHAAPLRPPEWQLELKFELVQLFTGVGALRTPEVAPACAARRVTGICHISQWSA